MQPQQDSVLFYKQCMEYVLIYLQKIYMQPAEEFEQVNLQIVQGQAPTRISLQKEELVKNKQTNNPLQTLIK